MKTKSFPLSEAVALAAGLFVFASTAARADVEDKINKSFTVSPGGQLVVAVDRGSIEVRTTDADAVKLEVTRKAGGSQSKAEKTLKDHVVTATQDGNKIEVHAELEGAKTSGLFGRSPDLNVSFLLTVPRRFDVDLKTAGGHIQVAELTGKLVAHTSGGNLDFKKIEGPVSAHTSGGHITVADAKGKVQLKTSGGNLNVSRVEGDVTASTSGGHITTEQLTGNVVVKTSGGNIKAKALKGSIEAKTSGGHINVELLEQPVGDCSLSTSGGHVTVTLAENVAVNVDAHTSGGRISSELPVTMTVQGEPKPHELRGKLNGGGPLLAARTSGGNVRLEKR